MSSPDLDHSAQGGESPEVVASRIVHRGRILTLRIDEVRLPEGDVVTREVVEHPGAVVIVAMDAAGRIALVRQYRHAVRRKLLELPAGTLEPGEEALATAARELREEVGLVAGTWDRLGMFYSSPGFLREEMHAFLARELVEVPAEPEADEDIAVEWRSLADLNAHPQQIEDSKSLACLLLATRLLDSENRRPETREG